MIFVDQFRREFLFKKGVQFIVIAVAIVAATILVPTEEPYFHPQQF